MKHLTTALILCFATSMSFAAKLPDTQLRGAYVEARTADVYTGPCFANSEVGLTGELAVMGWKIDKGNWQGVSLDGLSVVGVVRATSTLGDLFQPANPSKSVVIIDERANAEQRLALKSFAQKMGGDLLNDVVRVAYQPIEFTVDKQNIHSAKASLVAGNLAKIQTRAMKEGDQLCHNEEVWYKPLTNVDHAMPAYALAHSYNGAGLDTSWSSPEKRSAYVGTFHYRD